MGDVPNSFFGIKVGKKIQKNVFFMLLSEVFLVGGAWSIWRHIDQQTTTVVSRSCWVMLFFSHTDIEVGCLHRQPDDLI